MANRTTQRPASAGRFNRAGRPSSGRPGGRFGRKPAQSSGPQKALETISGMLSGGTGTRGRRGTKGGAAGMLKDLLGSRGRR
jgi:hypothetical protein